MAEKDKKYFWLKLKRDFFKRHDIRIIESMPNGKDYILFYLKLLCESVDHNGNLRFSDNIPYNEDMLATITNTNVDIVRNAVNVFTELGMMEVMDDGTYYMTEVNKMIGSETYWAEQKRKQRSLDNVQLLSNTSPTCPSKSQIKNKNESKSIEKEIEIETENRERENKERNTLTYFEPPSVEEVYDYCEGRHNGIDAQVFVDYYDARGWRNITDWRAQVRVWENRINQE